MSANSSMSDIMSTPILPVYFELSWSILSTIGAANVVFGLLIVGITTFSQITIVPIISSAAGAIANGLVYYAYYDETYSLKQKAAASAFGDLFWLVRVVPMSHACSRSRGREKRKRRD